MDTTMEIVVAVSGAMGAAMSFSIFMALMLWWCKPRRLESKICYDNEEHPRRKTCCCCRAGFSGASGASGGNDLKKDEQTSWRHCMVSGQEVMVFSRSHGTWVLARVCAIEDDGSVRVRYTQGTSGHEKLVSRHKVATSLRQAYHRGQTVLVFSEVQRRWVDGTIKVVQMDESLVIQAEGPGAPERLVIPRSLLKTNVRRLQYNNNTNTFTDNHFSARRGRLGDFIAM
mmetsp:Transcript_56225/g.111745  ORF Transcript_56225/g.111745 Transcript_56225/m.111745 type:complete len:228 (-) Transcript_56225:58-741(-)